MPEYAAPVRDLEFVLHELLNVETSGIEGYDALEPDLTGRDPGRGR